MEAQIYTSKNADNSGATVTVYQIDGDQGSSTRVWARPHDGRLVRQERRAGQEKWGRKVLGKGYEKMSQDIIDKVKEMMK